MGSGPLSTVEETVGSESESGVGPGVGGSPASSELISVQFRNNGHGPGSVTGKSLASD